MKKVYYYNLCKSSRDKSLDELQVHDISCSTMTLEEIQNEDVIIYVDRSGNEKVLKSRE